MDPESLIWLYLIEIVQFSLVQLLQRITLHRRTLILVDTAQDHLRKQATNNSEGLVSK